MILSEIQNKIYDLTGTDSTSYPNSKMLVDLNIWQSYVVAMINESQDESDYDDANYGNYPINTQNLIVARDYQIPPTEKVISIKDVNISYDGVNWYKATPIDNGEVEYPFPPSGATTANTTLDSRFSKTAPKYDVKYNSVFIYPMPSQQDVDAGGSIQIEWSRDAKDFTSSDLTTGTLTPSFDTAFHPMLAYDPASEYAISKRLDVKNDIQARLNELEQRLRKQYGDKQKDRVMQLKPSDQILQSYK